MPAENLCRPAAGGRSPALTPEPLPCDERHTGGGVVEAVPGGASGGSWFPRQRLTASALDDVRQGGDGSTAVGPGVRGVCRSGCRRWSGHGVRCGGDPYRPAASSCLLSSPATPVAAAGPVPLVGRAARQSVKAAGLRPPSGSRSVPRRLRRSSRKGRRRRQLSTGRGRRYRRRYVLHVRKSFIGNWVTASLIFFYKNVTKK